MSESTDLKPLSELEEDVGDRILRIYFDPDSEGLADIDAKTEDGELDLPSMVGAIRYTGEEAKEEIEELEGIKKSLNISFPKVEEEQDDPKEIRELLGSPDDYSEPLVLAPLTPSRFGYYDLGEQIQHIGLDRNLNFITKKRFPVAGYEVVEEDLGSDLHPRERQGKWTERALELYKNGEVNTRKGSFMTGMTENQFLSWFQKLEDSSDEPSIEKIQKEELAEGRNRIKEKIWRMEALDTYIDIKEMPAYVKRLHVDLKAMEGMKEDVKKGDIVQAYMPSGRDDFIAGYVWETGEEVEEMLDSGEYNLWTPEDADIVISALDPVNYEGGDLEEDIQMIGIDTEIPRIGNSLAQGIGYEVLERR